jgi:hypothetical protein
MAVSFAVQCTTIGEHRKGTTQTKSPAEIRGAFALNIVKRIVKRNEAFRPWQTWQRPTLPSLEA